jgi:hypothetical protein
MSIKQNGGVFGRNPTFNDVTIEGQLTFDGDIDINSDLKVDGTIEADKLIMEGSGSLLELYRSDANANFGAIELNDTTNTGTNAKIGWNANTLRLEATSTLQLVTNAKTRLQISSTGVQSFFNDSGGTEMYFNGANLVMASGRGIDFSATSGTGTSELFDDYEEGVWTPTYLGSTGDPTITYDMQYGIYVKVGRLCQAMLRIRTDAVSGGSGNLRIGGLPFSAFSAPTSSMSGGITVNRADSFTTNTPAFGVISNGNDYIDLNYDLAANAVTTANLTNAANSNTAIISLMYQTA